MTSFVGLDVGGTTARAVIVRDGEVVAHGTTKGGNLRQVGAEAVMRCLERAVLTADPNAELSECHVHAGLAGLATPNDEVALRAVPHPFASLSVESDAHLTLGAYFGGQPGVLLIVGTGVIVLGRNEHGDVGRRLGYGFPLETAGGAALGLSALRLGLAAWQDKPDAPLARLMTDRFGTIRNLVDSASGQGAAWYASHAPLLFSAAREGDATATRAVEEWRAECRRAVDSLRSELGVTRWGAWGGLSGQLGKLLDGYEPPATTPEVWAANVAARQVRPSGS